MTIDEKLDLLLEKVTQLEAALTSPRPQLGQLRYTLKQLSALEGRSPWFFRKEIRLRRLRPLPGRRPFIIAGEEYQRWRTGRKAG